MHSASLENRAGWSDDGRLTTAAPRPLRLIGKGALELWTVRGLPAAYLGSGFWGGAVARSTTA